MKKKQAYLINLVIRYSLFLSLPLAAFILIFSKPMIFIFAQYKYLPATQFFWILTITTIIFGLGSFLTSSLFAIRKPKINRNISIITAITFLLSSIPLTYFFSTFGLCIAYTLAATILLILGYLFIKKHLNIIVPFKSIFKIIISTLIFIFIAYLTNMTEFNFWIKMIITAIAVLIYLFVLIPLRFYQKEDIKIINYFSEKLPKFNRILNIISNFLSKYVETED